ncbi:hypothetical protein FDF11_14645 [Clostridium botulinum]|nr:hypothetical protein [Clostridium botulinum]NFR14508.1 hypothetical protein [Clostridium botulinum]NFR44681.1 hypothetical protein [Clostridium botulinum]NFS51867.1 hypothetical protein [Clostridium botulinum]
MHSSESKCAYDTTEIIKGNRIIPIIVNKKLREINIGD